MVLDIQDKTTLHILNSMEDWVVEEKDLMILLIQHLMVLQILVAVADQVDLAVVV